MDTLLSWLLTSVIYGSVDWIHISSTSYVCKFMATFNTAQVPTSQFLLTAVLRMCSGCQVPVEMRSHV